METMHEDYALDLANKGDVLSALLYWALMILVTQVDEVQI